MDWSSLFTFNEAESYLNWLGWNFMCSCCSFYILTVLVKDLNNSIPFRTVLKKRKKERQTAEFLLLTECLLLTQQELTCTGCWVTCSCSSKNILWQVFLWTVVFRTLPPTEIGNGIYANTVNWKNVLSLLKALQDTLRTLFSFKKM